MTKQIKLQINVDIKACVNFCKRKSFVGIFNLLSIVIDCNIVEMPPKLITKVQATTFHIPLDVREISKHPFVISITPSKIPRNCDGNKLKMGENDVITTKNMAIIAPIDNMLKTLSIIIEDKS